MIGAAPGWTCRKIRKCAITSSTIVIFESNHGRYHLFSPLGGSLQRAPGTEARGAAGLRLDDRPRDEDAPDRAAGGGRADRCGRGRAVGLGDHRAARASLRPVPGARSERVRGAAVAEGGQA